MAPCLIDEAYDQVPDAFECVSDSTFLCICELALGSELADVGKVRANGAQGKVGRRSPRPATAGTRRSESHIWGVIAGDFRGAPHGTIRSATHGTIHACTAQPLPAVVFG